MSGFIPPSGDYQSLLTYRKAVIIYQATVLFCDRFIAKGDRTRDQMIQAARSGKQNIVEGSAASGTSKEMEIKLVNVAKASQEELLEDYRDALRRLQVEPWDKDGRRVRHVRDLGRTKDESFETYRAILEERDQEVCANIMLCLINQATYLLRRQVSALEKKFIEEGGMRERMTKARLEARRNQNEAH